MTKDFFDKRSKKQRAIDWALSQKYIKTSDVYRYGTQNFHNRAVRDIQDFAEKNPDKIRRLTDDEVSRSFGNIGEGVWVVL